MPLIGSNWFTIAATSWLGFLWLPTTPEKLITIPMAIFIHTKLFGPRDPKTREQLQQMYSEAKADWNKVKNTFRKVFIKMKNRKTLFWVGWTIWICMVVAKFALVMADVEFQWDPMFLVVPLSLIIVGGMPEQIEHKQKDKE